MNAPATLVIIEAPGKVAKLAVALSALGIQAKISATCGAIYNLPERKLGLAAGSLEPADWELVNPHFADDIVRQAKTASRIWLMTDVDDEGEHIANQVRSLLLKSGFAGDLRRVRAHALSAQDISAALEIAEPHLERGTCVRLMARRAIDRGIGFLLSDIRCGVHAVAGRLRALLLQSISERPLPTQRLSGHHPKRNGWRIHVETCEQDLPSLKALHDGFKRNSKELFAGAPTRKVSAPPPPPTLGARAVLLVANRLDLPVVQAQQILQEHYEGGRLSYPRSDSRKYRQATEASLRAQASRYGLRTRAEAVSAPDLPYAQNAHEAVHAIDADPLLGGELKGMAPRDAALVLMARRSLIPLALDAEVSRTQITQATVSAYLAKRGLAPLRAAIWKDEISEAGWTVLERGTVEQAAIRAIPTDQAILERVIDDNLGRPSTAVRLVEVMTRAGLVEDGRLSQIGADNLRYLEWRAPSLLAGHNLDAFLCASSWPSVGAAIEAGYKHLGLRVEDICTLRDIRAAAEADHAGVAKPDQDHGLG